MSKEKRGFEINGVSQTVPLRLKKLSFFDIFNPAFKTILRNLFIPFCFYVMSDIFTQHQIDNILSYIGGMVSYSF